MPAHKRIHSLPLVGVMLLLTLLVAHQSFGSRGRPPARPTVVAVVDLERVFEAIEERAAADSELRQMAVELEAEGELKKERIDQLEEDLEAYQPGSERHRKALEEWSMQSLEFQAYMEFSRRKLDFEKSRTLGRIYKDIKKAAAELAEAEGYDVVLVDDSIAELTPGTEVETNRQISARRILYASSEIDVSDKLIEQMNTQYQQRAGG